MSNTVTYLLLNFTPYHSDGTTMKE